MSLDKLKTEDLLALAEYAANNVVPDGVKVTVKAGLGLPTAISDAEKALANLKIISMYGKEVMKLRFIYIKKRMVI